jgi:hypothetical protein
MDYEFICRLVKEGLKSYYYKGKPVCLMDGAGISRNQERKSLSEAKEALVRNKLFLKPQIFIDYYIRLNFYYCRHLLSSLGLKKIIKKVKDFKHGRNA